MVPTDVGTVHQVLIVTVATVGTLVMTLEKSIARIHITLWNVKAMPYFRETLISFFPVCGFNSLNKFNEGQVIFDNVGCAATCPESHNPMHRVQNSYSCSVFCWCELL